MQRGHGDEFVTFYGLGAETYFKGPHTFPLVDVVCATHHIPTRPIGPLG